MNVDKFQKVHLLKKQISEEYIQLHNTQICKA
jgi:hypothetical protein